MGLLSGVTDAVKGVAGAVTGTASKALGAVTGGASNALSSILSGQGEAQSAGGNSDVTAALLMALLQSQGQQGQEEQYA